MAPGADVLAVQGRRGADHHQRPERLQRHRRGVRKLHSHHTDIKNDQEGRRGGTLGDDELRGADGRLILRMAQGEGRQGHTEEY